jgi:HSP20 family molecular chaperone IbpA
MARERNNNFVNEFAQIFGPSIGDMLSTVSVSTRSTSRNGYKIPVDIVNDSNYLYLYIEVPGVLKENIDVDFYNNKLTIIIDKIRAYDEPEVSEIKYGKFERVFTLPICVTKKETVSVCYTNGVLKVTINKTVEEENKFSLKPTE